MKKTKVELHIKDHLAITTITNNNGNIYFLGYQIINELLVDNSIYKKLTPSGVINIGYEYVINTLESSQHIDQIPKGNMISLTQGALFELLTVVGTKRAVELSLWISSVVIPICLGTGRNYREPTTTYVTSINMPKCNIYTNNLFGSLTVIEKDNKLMFIGEEVCSVLGYGNSSESLKYHVPVGDKFRKTKKELSDLGLLDYEGKLKRENKDLNNSKLLLFNKSESRSFTMIQNKDLKLNSNLLSSSEDLNSPNSELFNKPYEIGRKGATLITESGLYRLIFASKMKEAIKFQDWVFNEVLPSIRKTGAYKVGDTNKEIMKVVDKLSDKVSYLSDYIQRANEFSTESAKKALTYNHLNKAVNTITLSEFCKITYNSLEYGERTIIDALIEKKIFRADTKEPYQRYITQRIFELTIYWIGERIGTRINITGKGVNWLIKKLT